MWGDFSASKQTREQGIRIQGPQVNERASKLRDVCAASSQIPQSLLASLGLHLPLLYSCSSRMAWPQKLFHACNGNSSQLLKCLISSSPLIIHFCSWEAPHHDTFSSSRKRVPLGFAGFTSSVTEAGSNVAPGSGHHDPSNGRTRVFQRSRVLCAG